MRPLPLNHLLSSTANCLARLGAPLPNAGDGPGGEGGLSQLKSVQNPRLECDSLSHREKIQTVLAPSLLTPLPRREEGNRARKGFLILVLLCLPRLALGQVLPGTQPLDWQGDLSERMMDGAHRFVEHKIGESIEKRQRHWKRDFSSRQAYEASVEPNRQRFKKIIGVVDSRLPARMERFGDDDDPALIAETPLYRIFQVRWPVLEGVTGEGLLLEPKVVPAAYIAALPDADQTPEQLAGLATGIQRDAQFGRRLAERGVEVLVPTLIDRSSRWSGHPVFG